MAAVEEANLQQQALHQQAWRSGQQGGRFSVDPGGGTAASGSTQGHFNPFSQLQPHMIPQLSPYHLNALSTGYSGSGWDPTLLATQQALAQAQQNPVFYQQMAHWAAIQQQQQQQQSPLPSPTVRPESVSSDKANAKVPPARPTPQPSGLTTEDFRKKVLTQPGNLVSAFSAMPSFPPQFTTSSGHSTPQPSKLSLVDPASLALPLGSPNGLGKSFKEHSPTVDAPSPVQDLNFKAMSKDVDEYQSSLSRQMSAELEALPKVPTPKKEGKKVSITTQAIPIRPSASSSHNNRDRLARSPFSVSPLATNGFEGESAEELAENDPLATQMWKFFSKAKGKLPHSTRMENLSWRMGGMKLSQVLTAAGPGALDDDTDKGREIPSEEEELERRGRKSKSASHTPEYSGSSGPSDMDWKSQSRSRSRAPISDMDWRQASRSRSRARPRFSLPNLNDEAPPSSALHDTLPSIEQDLYAQLFGNFNPPASADDATAFSFLENIEQPADPLSDDWFTKALESDMLDWTKPLPAKDVAALRSFNMDPTAPSRQNGSVPGLLSEHNAPENQSLDFGFIPKLVRKTSADAIFSSSMAQLSKKVAAVDELPVLSRGNSVSAAPASIDLAALGRPAPSSGLSPILSPGNVGHLFLDTKQESHSAFSQAFKNLSPLVPAGSPSIHTPFAAFNSLPGSPIQTNGGYFHFPPLQSPGTLASSAFVDPSVLVGLSPGSSGQIPLLLQNQLAALQGVTTPVLDQELQWALSPDALSEQYSRPPSRSQISRHSSFAELAGLNMAELNASQQFEGGPQRTTSTKRKGENGHARSQSIPGASTASALENGIRGAGGDTSLVCSNCKTSNTPLWRRDEAGKPLCNGCGLFKKLHGVDRPLSLATGIVKKRNRSKLKDSTGEKKKPSGTARTASRKSSNAATKAASASPSTST